MELQQLLRAAETEVEATIAQPATPECTELSYAHITDNLMAPTAPHPNAEKLVSQVSGLTADEILAGLMPEISALYRAQEASAAALQEEVELRGILASRLTEMDVAFSEANAEINLAYNAGVDVENRLASALCDRHMANIHISTITAERDSYLNDIRQAHSLLCDTLVRLRAYTEVESENEYRNYLGRMTLLKVVEELVIAAITSDDFRGNFVKRVAKLRNECPAMQATAGGNSE